MTKHLQTSVSYIFPNPVRWLTLSILVILFVCGEASPGRCEPLPDLIADGESVYPPNGGVYGSMKAINGGIFGVIGTLQANKLVIDASSTMKVGAHGQRAFIGGVGPYGSGGGYGGRGGGPMGDTLVSGSPGSPSTNGGSSGNRGRTFDDYYFNGPYGYLHVVCPGGYGGRGGGYIFFTADSLIIDGTVEANGLEGEDVMPPYNRRDPDGNRIGYGGGGGSGGGILFVTKSLTIGDSAAFHADGAKGGDAPSGNGYGGGGGRIKIFYETGEISPSATFSVKGAEEWPDVDLGPDQSWYAADGTVYIQQVRSIDALLNPDTAADLNQDGVIDDKDLFILLDSWGKEAEPAPTAVMIAPTVTTTPSVTITPTMTPSPTATNTPARLPFRSE